MRGALIIVILLLTTHQSQSQNFDKNRREFIFTNLAVNGIIGGVGSLINKRKGEKPFKVFLKGFGQGCLGGTVQFVAKDLTYQVAARENLYYA